MKYWITTHWPQRIGDEPDDSLGVWVSDGRENVIKRITPGDKVWIYESGTGRTITRKRADGSSELIYCKKGRQGIIALVEVVEHAYSLSDSEPENYTDGTSLWWRWYAPTRTINSAGFIPRKITAKLLGYSEEYVFRGFGHEHSGLMEIPRDTFNEILQKYITFSKQKDFKKLENAKSLQQRSRKGGEGPVHEHMKELIAGNPSDILSEPGLILVEVEYKFPTSDRVDLLLQDSYGRFVTVEIEPDCGKNEMAGPLQCLKYRSLLSYIIERPISEVRTILVSRSIHRIVRKRCRDYDIETKIIKVNIK